MTDLRWRKSSRSDGGGGNCVEVALPVGWVLVRDSKNRAAGRIEVGRAAWQRFLAGARGGAFDR